MQRTVTTRAGRYRMNFYTTQRRNAGTGTQRLRFTVDGVVVNTVTPSSLPSYGWRSTLDFSLSAGSHTIRIQGLVTTGDETAFIDAVMLESLVWLHGDHLGSANLATSSDGIALSGSSQRYSPFGSPLVSGSGLPSKYTFMRRCRIGAHLGMHHASLLSKNAPRRLYALQFHKQALKPEAQENL